MKPKNAPNHAVAHTLTRWPRQWRDAIRAVPKNFTGQFFFNQKEGAT